MRFVFGIAFLGEELAWCLVMMTWNEQHGEIEITHTLDRGLGLARLNHFSR